MPYADRTKQLGYMRDYMKCKRAVKRLERLKQDREAFKARFEANSDLKLLYHNFDPTTIYDREIAELEGIVQNCANLCKNVTQCHLDTDTVNPETIGLPKMVKNGKIDGA